MNDVDTMLEVLDNCEAVYQSHVFPPQLTTVEGAAIRLIRNTDFKTAATSTLDVPVTESQWRRLLQHVEQERAAVCPGHEGDSDKVRIILMFCG